MQIHSFTVGPFAENTYLITSSESALLVDPGFFEDHEFEAFKKKLDELEYELTAVVLTHAHIDHVLGLAKVKNEFDVPVYLNDSDDFLWKNYPSQAQRFGFNAEPFGFTPQPLPEQDGWKIAGFSFDVLYTPGHSPDHVSLYAAEHNIVIAGDALFRQGIGRTDLYKGDFSLLETSIKEKLYTLPDETEVYPGHGPKTTIGYEKKNNPFVKG
ncbi:MAG: MBL fold metallo-hydrolase [Balneolaceae bacterium]|nr:MBL fold metallo-hydrolase [Balneolaceae bacterium]